jgi:hypothetical protein
MAPARTCECGTCNTCKQRERARERYHNDVEYREKVRTAVKESRDRRIEYVREYDRQRGFRETDKQKIKARNATRVLNRGNHKCEVCGSHPADAHHDDYTKPLDVRWLCEPHHMQVHRRIP